MKIKVLLVSLLGFALAQESNTIQTIKLLEQANNEIFIIAPAFRVRQIAQATLNALGQRSVKVFALTEKAYVLEPASYWWHLEVWGAQIKTIKKVAAYQIIIDGRHLISGSEMALGYALTPSSIVSGPKALEACYAARKVWLSGMSLNTENIERQRRNLKPIVVPISSLPCGGK
jgi:hypothetical protein